MTAPVHPAYLRRLPAPPRPRGTRRLRVAAALQLVQGVIMEGFPFFGLFLLQWARIDAPLLADAVPIFALPYLQDNLYLVMILGGVFGALRVAGAVGLLSNRLWGFALTVVNCSVTLTLMIFVLPVGILDGLLSGATLVLVLTVRYGRATITT